MKEKQSEGCACDKPEIRDQFSRGSCSLNQIIKCHGDQPVDELFKHIELKKEE
ncbi:MAG: hypothetical protein KGD65_12660 [Candidatus Lokiarchaeota archaeon]|nr:hypothetical protein [Candidatus Lokiarchaeota archaeon]